MMYISLAAKVSINVEALNAVESVGYVTKHRKAPVIVPEKATGGYAIRYVPAISGESIGHAFQRNTAEFANVVYDGNPPLCKWCARGEFLKEMSEDYMIEEAKEVAEKAKGLIKGAKTGEGGEAEVKERSKSKRKKAEIVEEWTELKHEFEKAVINKCLVEDIGGFLSAEEFPVKRTSAFQVGYVIPTLDSIETTVVDTQFHVRHAPVMAGLKAGETEGAKAEKTRKAEANEKPAAQMIYYVEIASAIYGVHFDLDLDAIGRTRLVRVENALDEEERKRRILVALGGLALTIAGSYGAKRSRFNPISKVESMVLSLSEPLPFSVTPPHSKGYITSTAKRAELFVSLLTNLGTKPSIKLFAYDPEGKEKIPSVTYFDNVEALLDGLVKEVLSALPK